MGNSRFLESTLLQLELLAETNEIKRKREKLKGALLSISPFSANEKKKTAVISRLQKAENDFWYFDKTYFPKSFYGDDYSAPGKFHKDIDEISDSKDKKVHLVLGPREHAKTAIYQKKVLWKFLFGKAQFMAIGSETLDTPDNYLADLIYYTKFNDRIAHDFKLTWHECSTKKMFATSDQNPKGTFIQTLSEEKSSRGKQRLQRRFDFILLTDFENSTSSLTKDARRKRRSRLNEMRGSLTKNGCLVWEANNFDVDTLSNELLEEQEKGIGSKSIVVHVFPAWDSNRPYKQRALWPQRFPAKSEEELMEMVVIEDRYDWLGNYQQRPEEKSGEIFPKSFYSEWATLPNDVQAVIWVDPNCSEKKKGDTTGMPCLGFSPTTKKFYITNMRCKSYFLSNDLLTDLLRLQQNEVSKGISIITIGMDGNVSQESIWKNNIHNFVTINRFPFPFVNFRKYNVDLLVTNLESIYKCGDLLFPPNFASSEEGKAALKQFNGFRMKKANKKDDFPDAVICAYTLLIELGVSFILDSNINQMVSVNNYKVKRL